MGQLGGQGDDPVMLFRRGALHPAKAQGEEPVLHPLQHRGGEIRGGGQDHGGLLEQIPPGYAVAAFFHARHGVAPQVEEAVLPGQLFQRAADRPLDAAQVDDHALAAHGGGPAGQVFHCRLGVEGQKEQVAFPQGRFGQFAGQDPFGQRLGHHFGRFVAAQHPVPTAVGRLGHRAADEPQANDANGQIFIVQHRDGSPPLCASGCRNRQVSKIGGRRTGRGPGRCAPR